MGGYAMSEEWSGDLLAAHIHAAEHRFLELVAEFDRRDGWKLGGHRNCAAWLHFRTGIAMGAAREKVRAARALRRMPLTSEAMSRGELSFSKVRALTRVVDDLAAADEDSAALEGTAPAVADPAREAELLKYARECTAAQMEQLIRGWRHIRDGDEAEVERRRHRSRYLSVSPQGDGMYTIRGRLDPEVGALLMRAIEAAGDALFREGDDWAPEGGPRGPKTREVTPRQRRADALGLLAERALAAGFGRVPPEEGREEPEDDDRAVEDASTSSCTCAEPPLSGTRAERYQVVLHVDADTLAGEGSEGSGESDGELPTAALHPRSHLSDGQRVSAETSRRLSCDAGVVRVVRGKPEGPGPGRPGGEGSVLDVGRRTRTIPPALRRALEIRDGGCRFPGCGLRFTDAHHIIHWADGGETKLKNLVLLCGHHHQAVHEEGFQVRMGQDGRPRFFDRTGWPLPDAPPPSRLPPNAWEQLVRRHREGGLDPAPDTPSARYEGGRDLPPGLEDRAREALDPPE